MASIIYDSCLYSVFRSLIHFESDEFKIMLVSPDYVPDKANDRVRSDVLDFEIPDEGGYLRGGVSVDVSMINDISNNRVEIVLGGTEWKFSSITANGAVYYKARRGPPSSDELICYVQFNQRTSSIDGAFTITPSRIRIQN
jgi:hypothetical protein